MCDSDRKSCVQILSESYLYGLVQLKSNRISITAVYISHSSELYCNTHASLSICSRSLQIRASRGLTPSMGVKIVTLIVSIFCSLHLSEPPRISTIFPTYQLVNESGMFKIFCNLTGNPPPTITWSKDGGSSKIYPTGNTLHIENVDKLDSGTYKCTGVSVRGENATADASVVLDFCKSNSCINKSKAAILL